MRSPLKPLPAAVARWIVTARILRWLDALVAWLGVWGGAALARPSASRESLALLAVLVVALGALARPLRARWRPVSGGGGLAPSARVSPGDQAGDVRPGDAQRVLVTARPRPFAGRAGHDGVESLADP